jgi:hypothetical protein
MRLTATTVADKLGSIMAEEKPKPKPRPTGRPPMIPKRDDPNHPRGNPDKGGGGKY